VDYRRHVFELYRCIRQLGSDHPASFLLFKETRDNLFKNHLQSALTQEQKLKFNGIKYYDYDSKYKAKGVKFIVYPQNKDPNIIHNYDNGIEVELKQIGTVTFKIEKNNGSLAVYWIQCYGGGIFIPFRDETNGDTTYSGGRYLYDTIKGADLGLTVTENQQVPVLIILDFNYAYNPSCSYNVRWKCPLALDENKLNFRVEAGEKITSNMTH